MRGATGLGRANGAIWEKSKTGIQWAHLQMRKNSHRAGSRCMRLQAHTPAGTGCDLKRGRGGVPALLEGALLPRGAVRGVTGGPSNHTRLRKTAVGPRYSVRWSNPPTDSRLPSGTPGLPGNTSSAGASAGTPPETPQGPALRTACMSSHGRTLYFPNQSQSTLVHHPSAANFALVNLREPELGVHALLGS
ncbi:hypothetical protein VTN00DRAFT_628 [Thermoascus crustaceus]|uniref:uncharacterized protein n=1 Tax=Thermoascus crustaceus TaxID=5088 RepID=UPI0037440ACD